MKQKLNCTFIRGSYCTANIVEFGSVRMNDVNVVGVGGIQSHAWPIALEIWLGGVKAWAWTMVI